MPNKKETGKKGGFSLSPITLSEPVRATDGFTNLVDPPNVTGETKNSEQKNTKINLSEGTETKNETSAENQIGQTITELSGEEKRQQPSEERQNGNDENVENSAENKNMTEAELLQILDADSLDEIYELTDVLRASSLKLYATLVRLADSRGRTRVKNHELMSKAGIKGIATLYKQERWLMDLKLLEKKAKPGPHDGSSYVIHKLETLPLPAEIYEKFNDYLAHQK